MIDLINSQIGIIVGIFTVLGLIFGPRAAPSVIKWLKNILDAIAYPLRKTDRSVEDLKTSHKVLETKIDILISQVLPNGGKSLHDSINRLEKSILNIDNRYSIMPNIPPMFEANEEGLCTWASKTYLDLVEKTMEDLRGWGWLSHIHTDDVEKVSNAWEKAVSGKKPYSLRSKYISTSGKIYEITCRSSPTYLNKDIVGWAGVLSDIKEIHE